jgi:hypothetical protein
MLMNMKLCLFCNEQVYKTDADYICGSCVQLLLNADQADLERAYKNAIDKGYSNKARAIESFFIPEEINVRKTQKSKRNMVRKRPLRKARPPRDELRP